MTLYKGPLIPLPWSNPTMDQQNGHTNSSEDHNNWVVGTLLILLGCVAWSGFYVLQVRSLLFLFIRNIIYLPIHKPIILKSKLLLLVIYITFWPPSQSICVESSI